MNTFKIVLARIVIAGIFISAAAMALGMAIFLFYHGENAPGDHLFRGEPMCLRDPVDIARAALKGDDRSFIQLGVLLLLASPFFRVTSAALGYVLNKDVLYAAVSATVLCILTISFFI